MRGVRLLACHESIFRTVRSVTATCQRGETTQVGCCEARFHVSGRMSAKGRGCVKRRSPTIIEHCTVTARATAWQIFRIFYLKSNRIARFRKGGEFSHGLDPFRTFYDQDGGRVYSGDCIRTGRLSRCQLLHLPRLPFYPIAACNSCALPVRLAGNRSPAGRFTRRGRASFSPFWEDPMPRAATVL